MQPSQKVRENRLRKMAERQKLYVQKSKRRDKRAHDFGRYRIVDERNVIVVGGKDIGDFTMTLDEVETYLEKE